jgi:hypothetical protein
MYEDYCKITLDLSRGSAYEFRSGSSIPTKIKYGRMHSGKFQKGNIEGDFNNNELHNIVYAIKRGFTIEEINHVVKSYTK